MRMRWAKLALEAQVLTLAVLSHVRAQGSDAPSTVPATFAALLPNPATFPARIDISNLLAHTDRIQQFADNRLARNRFIGTPGHEASIQYLLDQLQDPALGGYYDVSTQQFDSTIQTGAAGSLAINGAIIPIVIGQFSPSTSGGVNAALALVANRGCNATDYSEAVKGGLVLAERGACAFTDKATRAAAAGALGLVVYSDRPESPRGFTLGSSTAPRTPTVLISREAGLAIAGQIASGATVTAALNVKVDIATITSRNVFAQTKGTDPNQVVFLGAHTDSVLPGPGINDNGSGTASILEVARQLARFRTKTTLRFGFWAAEELGLLGSNYYVNTLPAAERSRIKVYLNFDMVASKNYVLGIYDGAGTAYPNSTLVAPPGSASIQALFQDFFTAENRSYRAAEFTGRSDYGPFVAAGIASGGLFTGASGLKSADEAADFGGTAGQPYDAHYHRAGDTRENLDNEAFLLNARAMAYVTAVYGRGLESVDFTPRPRAKGSSGMGSVGLSGRSWGGVAERGGVFKGTGLAMGRAPEGQHACSMELDEV